MGWGMQRFQEAHNLHHGEVLKAFRFITLAVPAMAYLFLFGYLSAGGRVGEPVLLVLIAVTAIDIAPTPLLLRFRNDFGDRARRAEHLHMLLAAAAYGVLAATLLGWLGVSTVVGFGAFAVLWILSFAVEIGALAVMRLPDAAGAHH